MAQRKRSSRFPDVIEGVVSGDSDPKRQRISQIVSDMADATLYDFLVKASKKPGPVTDSTRSLYRNMAVDVFLIGGGDNELQINSDIPTNGPASSSGYAHSVTRLAGNSYDHPIVRSVDIEYATTDFDADTASEASQVSSISTIYSEDDTVASMPGCIYRQASEVSPLPMEPPSIVRRQDACTQRKVSKGLSKFIFEGEPLPTSYAKNDLQVKTGGGDTSWDVYLKKGLVIGAATTITLALFYILWYIKSGTSETDELDQELEKTLASME